VIYLTSESDSSGSSNSYGYWQGKNYSFHGEMIPYTDREITGNTKIYKRKVMAEKMAEKLFNRCAYVYGWKIESY